MKTIESMIFEKYEWIEKGQNKKMYICVPATLVVIGDNKQKTQFIFWN
jgi:hypothetical protein